MTDVEDQIKKLEKASTDFDNHMYWFSIGGDVSVKQLDSKFRELKSITKRLRKEAIRLDKLNGNKS